MQLSGFSFIRNGMKFDFPFRESLRSLLPICDEVVVAVGKSDDDTREMLTQFNEPKIRILDTVWDESLKQGGAVLADETNKALRACQGRYCLYLQADEVLHEQDYTVLKQTLKTLESRPDVDGALLNYLHFYGNYSTLLRGPTMYRREVRLIRNDPTIFSYRDAQGFRKQPNSKLRVLNSSARIFHYGYVRPPQVMKEKLAYSDSLYHSGQTGSHEYFDCGRYPWTVGLTPFRGTHPQTMNERIARHQKIWTSNHLTTIQRPQLKQLLNPKMLNTWVRYTSERLTGWRVGEYRNYHQIG